MKKLIAVLLAVAFSAVCAYSASPSATQLVSCDWELVQASTAVVRVTGTAAGTIFTKVNITPGWEYILVTVDSVGGATDSAYTTILGYGSDNSTQTSSTEVVVHRNGTTYTCSSIPIGSTIFGRSISATLTRYAATNKTKISRWELYKRRITEAKVDSYIRR